MPLHERAREAEGNAGATSAAVAFREYGTAVPCGRVATQTDSDEQRLRDYFEQGFRDLQLADIKLANENDVRMGTFQLCAAFLDALALAYSAPPLPAKVKGGKAGKWDRFVADFLPQPKYASLVGTYEGFRCLLLHNFSASRLAFTHGKARLHLKTHGGRRLLNRESFVADVEAAFEAFYANVQSDERLGDRVVKHLDKFPPIGVWFLEPDESGPPPVATAAFPPGNFAASEALSASFSTTPIRVEGGEQWRRAPSDPPSAMAPSIKQPKKKKQH